MPKANKHPADISVIVAKNGHALVFQGFHHQALFIMRGHLPRFLENPQHAALLVIPPFAATALACYIAMEEHPSIEVSQDLSLGDAFSLVITTSRGARIAYYSDDAASECAHSMARQGIGIAITPRSVVTVDKFGTSPAKASIASIPHPQTPDYPGRFAVESNIIQEALQEALYKSNTTLRYAK